MSNLLEKIKKWDKAYALGKPLVSDAVYDKAKEKLNKETPRHYSYAPGKKVKLPSQMTSLEKIKPNDLENFTKNSSKHTFLITPKFDGLSLKLVYKKGKLVKGYTAGDGIIGRDVTPLAFKLNNVPLRLASKINLQVDGEAIIPNSIFKEKFPNEKNPRNTAVGLLNRKKASSRLKHVAFIVFNSDLPVDQKDQMLFQLTDHGFSTVRCPSFWYSEKYKLAKSMKYHQTALYPTYVEMGTCLFYGDNLTPEMCISQLKYWQENLDFLLDGLVIEYNVLKMHKKLGIKGDYPKYAKAIKLDPENQISKIGIIKKIEHKISSRGILKPVAVFKKPLDFNGIMVSRCTLHNFSIVKKNKIGVGSKVKIIRSGDVIPRFMKTISSKGCEIPKTCEFCNSKLKWTNTDLICDNPICEGYLSQRTVDFFKRIKIDNLSKETVKKFMKKGYNTPAKILAMTKKDLLKIPGFAKKSASTLEKALKNYKPTVPQVMWASGIFSDPMTSFGPIRAETIAKELGRDLLTHPINNSLRLRLVKIPGIGLILSQVLLDNLDTFRMFYNTLGREINFVNKGPLSGKVFVFTGFRDTALENMILENGGTVKNAVTNDTTALFAADLGSTKAIQAKAKNKLIIDKPNVEKYLKGLMK